MYHLSAEALLFTADLTELILEALKTDIHSGGCSDFAIRQADLVGFNKNIRYTFEIYSPQYKTLSKTSPQQVLDLATYLKKIIKVLEPKGLGICHVELSEWSSGRFSVTIDIQDKWWERE